MRPAHRDVIGHSERSGASFIVPFPNRYDASGQQLFEGQRDRTRGTVPDDTELNDRPVLTPHQVTEFRLPYGLSRYTVNLSDEVANANPGSGCRRVRQDGNDAEPGTIGLDGLEPALPLDRLRAKGWRMFDPNFAARVVESNHKLAQNLVSDAAIDARHRKSAFSI
jgi:hypothetical protein